MPQPLLISELALSGFQGLLDPALLPGLKLHIALY